ncbi:hypothetical protein G6F37_012601 [Rhizopus arrhizus]|nr:hypothetical protein G6F38_012604 [Rhizopus arrhizus]KAG1142648.1 hypothetical protein G6F37_012601 [Rhizopus arrhizus]
MEEIIRNVVRQMDVKKKKKPMETKYHWTSLMSWPTPHRINSRRTLRSSEEKLNDTRWMSGQLWKKINKTILPYLKRHSTETAMVVNTIYKITENTRFQARVAMEIFEQLQYVLQEATSQAEATAIIDKCREQSRRLAVFGLATAKA